MLTTCTLYISAMLKDRQYYMIICSYIINITDQ